MASASPIHAVALTGGIATGKSTCLRRFAALGVPTIDADHLAREAVRPGSPGLDAVVARFGRGILDAHGALDRRALAALVFGDEGQRRQLEAIVHPQVFAGISTWLETLASAPAAPQLAIADVPLLFETGRESDFDSVVVAVCPPDVQLARLTERDRLTRDEAARRIAAQWPIAIKRERADYVIDTGGSIKDTEQQVDEVLAALRSDVARDPRR